MRWQPGLLRACHLPVRRVAHSRDLQSTSNVPLNLPIQPHPQVELCPGGGHQLVTAVNLEQYIALLARYKQVLPSDC